MPEIRGAFEDEQQVGPPPAVDPGAPSQAPREATASDRRRPGLVHPDAAVWTIEWTERVPTSRWM